MRCYECDQAAYGDCDRCGAVFCYDQNLKGMAMVTLGTPAFSAAMLARELAAVQLPHPATPEMTTSTPRRFRLSGRSRMICAS